MSELSELGAIECDGGPHCQSRRHIHGCFADVRDCDLVAEANSVRESLAKASSERDKYRDALREIERAFTYELGPASAVTIARAALRDDTALAGSVAPETPDENDDPIGLRYGDYR